MSDIIGPRRDALLFAADKSARRVEELENALRSVYFEIMPFALADDSEANKHIDTACTTIHAVLSKIAK